MSLAERHRIDRMMGNQEAINFENVVAIIETPDLEASLDTVPQIADEEEGLVSDGLITDIPAELEDRTNTKETKEIKNLCSQDKSQFWFIQ